MILGFAIFGMFCAWLVGLFGGAVICAWLFPDELGGHGGFWTWILIYVVVTIVAGGIWILA